MAEQLIQFVANKPLPSPGGGMAAKFLAIGFGIPCAIGVLVCGAIITSYGLSFAYTGWQQAVALFGGIAVTLSIAMLPIIAELNEKPAAKQAAWWLWGGCLSLAVVAWLAYAIIAPTSPAESKPSAVGMPIQAMKARLAEINIDPRPEGIILDDIECHRHYCPYRTIYSLRRLQDELEARHLQNAIKADRGRTRTADAGPDGSGSRFMAAAKTASAGGLNVLLPGLLLLICAGGVALLAGAIATVTGFVAPSLPVTASPPVSDQAKLIQQTFEAWVGQCLQQGGPGSETSAKLLYDHHCAFATWTGGRAYGGPEVLGAAMKGPGGPLQKFQGVPVKVGKEGNTSYTMVEIRMDGISGQLLAQLGGTA